MSRNSGDASVQHTHAPTRPSADAHAGPSSIGPRAQSNDTPFVLGGAAAATATGHDPARAEPSGAEPAVELTGGSDGEPMVVATEGLGPDGFDPGA